MAIAGTTGTAAAIYMGVKASSFIAGRLLMHGAAANTPVTVVSNASRPDQQIITTTLAQLPNVVDEDVKTPAILLFGLARQRVGNSVELTEQKLVGAV